MPAFDKYLEMLKSPRAGTRYDACEWLRVARESSKEVIAALEFALQDKDSEVATAAKRALDADVHVEMLEKLGRPRQKSEAELRREQETQELAKIIIVTTPFIENHTVKAYLGIVSAEVVLGTGFLTEFGAGIADFLGERADKIENKLKEAKGAALQVLRRRAFELHANAILAVDLDYSVLANNMLMLLVNGTAVIIE